MERSLEPARGPITGEIVVPGDKSISHRVVLFSAMAEGESHHEGVADSADVRSTIRAVGALGAEVDVAESGDGSLSVSVRGWGADGPRPASDPIDCGNSGTTVRLLMGVLAGWSGEWTLAGDESLSKRPMARVTEPLSRMGATFEARDGDLLPVTVRGGDLSALEFDSPVASAQVKTAVLLAGLRAAGRTTVTEPAPSRDHTERLLPAFGAEVGRSDDGLSAWVDGPATLSGCDVVVPGDPSSAAFFVGAALVVPRGSAVIRGVSLNPTRNGYLRVLERMGADIVVRPTGETGLEPVGDVEVRRSPLRSTVVEAGEAPSLIDEIPILAVVAARAEGTTRFEGVGELRVKESDRLEAVATCLGAMGVEVRSGDDWLEVIGPARLQAARVDSLGDHRLAMAFSVAALVAEGTTQIARYDAIDVSYPGFGEALRRAQEA